MKKAIIIGFSILVCLILSGGHIISSYDLDNIRVSKDQIDKVLQEKLPITKPAFVYDVTIAKADLDLSEAKIGVLATVEIKKKDCNSKVPTVKWKKAQQFLGKVQEKCNSLSNDVHVVEFLAIGTLKYANKQFRFVPNGPNDVVIKTNLKEKFLQDNRQMVDAVLQKIVLHYLSNFPVYKFNNTTKQTLISMAIDSVEVHTDYIQVNVSFLELTMSLVFNVVILMIALTVVVVLARAGIIFPS